jgi:hypothetical protein
MWRAARGAGVAARLVWMYARSLRTAGIGCSVKSQFGTDGPITRVWGAYSPKCAGPIVAGRGRFGQRGRDGVENCPHGGPGRSRLKVTF